MVKWRLPNAGGFTSPREIADCEINGTNEVFGGGTPGGTGDVPKLMWPNHFYTD